MVRVREFAIVAAVAFVTMAAVAAIARHPFYRTSQIVALKTFIVRSEMEVAHLVPPQPQNEVADNTGPAVDILVPARPVVEIPPEATGVARPKWARAHALSRVAIATAVRPAQLLGLHTEAVAQAKSGKLRVADAPDMAPLVSDDTADLANAVALRVRDSVPQNLFPYFDVYLYVSKAAKGPWAQHMFIFHRGPDSHLVFEQSIPVSTGRERQEKYFTSTPTGLFELDPNRFDRNHHSHRWHNASMPWAMFLNYTINNHLAGVALHSAAGHVALLGQRASGGCVRLPPQMAKMLFKRFQADERGMVPAFAFNDSHSTTRTDGTLQLGADGQAVLVPGYKVLLIIQNDSGRPALVAEVS